MYQKEKNSEIWSRIVAKSWTDSEYKERLFNNSMQTLLDEGFELPENKDNLKITFLQDTETHKHWVIPAAPNNFAEFVGELSVLAAQRLDEQHELFPGK